MLSLLISLAAAQSVAPSYVQSVTDSKGITQLQIGTHKLTAAGKPDIWLVGAVHVGDKSYYRGLQQVLNAQDMVFFEGVKDDTGQTNGMGNQLGGFYRALGEGVGLDFQMNDIDYAHPNWVNKDLKLSELNAMSKATSGGKPSMYGSLQTIMDPKSGMLSQFTSAMKVMPPGSKEALRYFLLTKLATVDSGTPLMDPSSMAVIVTSRNKAVEDGVMAAINGPNPPKSIAIFYGALHLTGIESDFVSKLGYQDVLQTWFTAAKSDKSKIDAQGKMMLQAFDKMFNPASAPSAAKPVKKSASK